MKKALMLICILMILAGRVNSGQTAIIDGNISQGEYGNGVSYTFDLGYINAQGSWVGLASDGEIHVAWNSPNELAVAYQVPFSVNDNFFGVSSTLDNNYPWDGKGHTYNQLEHSDMAQFTFKDESGEILMNFQMDYFRDPSMPDVTHGRNKVDTVSNSYVDLVDGSGTQFHPGDNEFEDLITGMATSLMWNYSETGGQFLFDAGNSPTPDTDGYIRELIYEFSIDTSSFGRNIGMVLAESHQSPSKLDGFEAFVPDPATGTLAAPIPEPATLFLFGIGLIGLAGFNNKKKEESGVE